MHWTYKPGSTDDLEQGDILQRTDYLKNQVLGEYHPYYAKHKHNDFYIVLTQSCDLVLRGGVCKAPYIALAPVRPLRVVLDREFSPLLKNRGEKSQAYGSIRLRSQLEDFLTKLLNNNDPQYFFLRRQEDRQIPEDMCAITSLSISIKTEHYKECVTARVLQLDDLFQAKLGWLVGQRFSRVGTPDWSPEELQKQVANEVAKTAVWVDDAQIVQLDKQVEDRKAQSGLPVDQTLLQEEIGKLPSKKDQAISALFEVLISESLLPKDRDPIKGNLRKRLRNDATFSRFFST